MRLEKESCRTRAGAARVARLATAGADSQPHVVPVTFALTGSEVVIGIDQKPKSTVNLRRLRNIAENSRVSLLWDHYDDDWTQLWWVRGDGKASVVEGGDARRSAIEALRAKYEQYRDDPPQGPVIVISFESWSGWAFSS
jgi:PPOX class probable F420-dependent enzyme